MEKGGRGKNCRCDGFGWILAALYILTWRGHIVTSTRLENITENKGHVGREIRFLKKITREKDSREPAVLFLYLERK